MDLHLSKIETKHKSGKDEEIKDSKKFFNPSNLINKQKIKNVSYTAFYCVKTLHEDEDCICCWNSSIIKESNLESSKYNNDKIFGHSKGDHIVSRMNGLLQTLDYVVKDTSPELYKYINLNLYSNDPFILNLIKEWIPFWNKSNFYITSTSGGLTNNSLTSGGLTNNTSSSGELNENEERPNRELLIKISKISTKINITTQWLSDKSSEMINLSNTIDEYINKNLK